MRHPEQERFFEEDWFFEAVVETYLPLLLMLERLEKDELSFQVTIGFTPTLCSMLRDDLLRERCTDYLDRGIRLAEEDVIRRRKEGDNTCFALAEFYATHLRDLRDAWLRLDRDLVTAFRGFQDRGLIEIMASAATHGVLPLLGSEEAARAQVEGGCEIYRSLFGREPRGFWLPECAFAAEIEPLLASAGVRWTVLEGHGLQFAKPAPSNGIYRPCRTRGGIAVFGRDPVSSRQVWSAEAGYPGASDYRDFYRDLGYDLPLDALREYFGGEETRRFTGLKYHRVTGSTEDKELYDPAAAADLARHHAHHFARERGAQLAAVAPHVQGEPAALCAFDAELFGHWWFEGVHFLEAFIREAAAAPPGSPQGFKLTSPSTYLQRNPSLQRIEPASSTWGYRGHLETWLSDKNGWVYPPLHEASRRLVTLARHAVTGGPSPLQSRCLDQMARELLLAQASDWAFLMATGTAGDYGRKRTRDHLHRFRVLFDQLVSEKVSEPFLAECESRDNLFPELGWQLYAPRTPTGS